MDLSLKVCLLHFCSGRKEANSRAGRAVEGATVRRIFSSSPRDPRYHMLSYISDKFSQPFENHAREPRAALILNRFTRTSTILFATNGVEQILGFSPMQLVGKSFYYCIAENCLTEAVRTLESAKGNDSIAYLRFFFRDPTLPDPPVIDLGDSDSDEESDGGVRLRSSRSPTTSSVDMGSPSPMSSEKVPEISINSPPLDVDGTVGPRNTQDGSPEEALEVDGIPSRTSSGNSTDFDANGQDGIFDEPMYQARSSASSITPQETPSPGVIEVEAVVSCTSDGLVVVLRRAHSMIPQTTGAPQPQYPDGLFASPWAEQPIVPDSLRQATSVPSLAFPPVTEPSEAGLMSAIRDVAVFAWSLTGINGRLIDHAKGLPRDQAIPPGGLPVWDPNAPIGQNDCYNGFSGGTHRPIPGMGDPKGIDHRDGDITGDLTSSDDEIVWKRVPQMPVYKRPKRRAHTDAFGDEGEDSTDNGGVQVQDKRRRKLDNGQRQNST